jgi:hypothetical protein
MLSFVPAGGFRGAFDLAAKTPGFSQPDL